MRTHAGTRLAGGRRSGGCGTDRSLITVRARAPPALPTLAAVPTAEPLRSRLSHPWRLLLRELGAFGVVGVVCFVIDVCLFQALYSAGLDPVRAKLVATLVSLTVAFTGHRFWSFGHRARTGLGREYLRFGLVNALTLGLGLAVIAVVRYPLGQESSLVLQAANIGSIATGTVIRFTAYRRWVFPATRSAPTGSDAPRRPQDAAACDRGDVRTGRPTLRPCDRPGPPQPAGRRPDRPAAQPGATGAGTP
jgi:putative flippase GtrA